MKAVHVAPLHKRQDTRVLLKECVSLADEGIETICIVADGEGDETFRGVRILDCGRPPAGKFAKRLVPLYRAARRARREPHDLIHFHDGMFLPFAIVLALIGHRVIYDVHEDYREQFLNSQFVLPVKKTVSLLYVGLEWLGSKVFTSIVCATPHIMRHFPARKTILVQNFPILSELIVQNDLPYTKRGASFVYVGGISSLRGVQQMIDAIHQVTICDASLELVGSFSPASLQATMENLPGWQQVNFHGWLGRMGVASVLGSTRAGLCVLHPTRNYRESLPIKLFEYMAAGIPVIASNFPLWQEIIMEAQCGLVVDPLDPKAIAKSMSWILEYPEEAAAMGQRGRRAVVETYNWAGESRKLIALYRFLETQ